MHGPVIIKLGGSLLERDSGESLRGLGQVLAERATASGQILIVPGGGPFADTVRRYWEQLRLPEETCHFMALAAMSQYAYLLREFIPGSRVSELGREDHAHPGVQILLCEGYLREVPEKSLPRNWEVTSDSIAAFLARELGASMLVLLKSTDISPDLRPPGVDEHFGKLLPLPCPTWFLSGGHPQRLGQLLAGERTQGLYLPPNARTAAAENP